MKVIPDAITVIIHHDEGLWAEVTELPGCFAAGNDMAELAEALDEAVSLYLSEDDHTVKVQLAVITEQAHLITVPA